MKENKTMNYGLIIVVGLLLVVSVVQAGQIQSLKGESSDVDITEASESPTSTRSPAPSQPRQAPAMVGGC